MLWLWCRLAATAQVQPLAWEWHMDICHECSSKKTKTNKKKQVNGKKKGVPFVAQQLTNLTRIHEDAGLLPRLIQWVKDLVVP